MTYTPDIVVFIFCIQFFSYSLKRLVGFGNPLVAGPLLSMQLDNVLITPGTLVLDCPVNAWIVWKSRDRFQWKKILPLMAANLAGVIPGALLLRGSMPWVLKALLGVVVLGLGLEMATRDLRPVRPDRFPSWFRYVVSLASGVCSGLFGINLLFTSYLQRAAKDYEEFRGSLCFLFLGENLFRLCVYLFSGILTRDVWLFVAVSAPATVLAMVLAGRLAPRLDEKKLQKAAVVLFLLCGVSILVKALVFHT